MNLLDRIVLAAPNFFGPNTVRKALVSETKRRCEESNLSCWGRGFIDSSKPGDFIIETFSGDLIVIISEQTSVNEIHAFAAAHPNADCYIFQFAGRRETRLDDTAEENAVGLEYLDDPKKIAQFLTTENDKHNCGGLVSRGTLTSISG